MEDEMRLILATRNWKKNFRDRSKDALDAELAFDMKESPVVKEGRREPKNFKKMAFLALYDEETSGKASGYNDVRVYSEVIAKMNRQSAFIILKDMKQFYDLGLLSPANRDSYEFSEHGSYKLSGMGKALAEYFKAEDEFEKERKAAESMKVGNRHM